MRRSLAAVAVATLSAVLVPVPAVAATLPTGEYGCYTYNPRANYVGGLAIRGDSYQSKTGASGRYRLADGGGVEFLGEAPLGFVVAAANFIGVWYEASVARCDAARCLLHYDDPSSKNEWVDQSRLRAR